ncbi:hypothetical protein Hypma_000441 [Hypsizygus marmoreus]|uniref:Uncharacterized protein n=1 Tax=Hypsizygus marmoreus TaxID=39966 RepID=A0A369JBW5_HYPMA|nr:hypothetical protein Hypma_000441 [Hypsizygus marmoreus]
MHHYSESHVQHAAMITSESIAEETKTTIHSLPSELVSSIFKYTYMKSRVELRRRSYIDSNNNDINFKTTWKQEDLLEPSLFPRAITSTCRRWKAIAECHPIFWTRIIAFVDSTPTPLSEVLLYLTLSKDLPIHVYVLRRPDTYLDQGLDEHQRCRDVIELLRPHIRRCQKISFDVIYSSSLPSISQDFFGSASFLETLNLKCRTDDGRAPGASGCRPEIDNDPFLTPALKELVVDGRNFSHACLMIPAWIESLKGHEFQLQVHTFTPSQSIPRDLAFTLRDFVNVLDQLRVNRLSLYVEFHNVPPSTPTPDFILPADSYMLDNLSSWFLTEIMEILANDYVDSIYISRCPVGAVDFEFSAHYLTLDTIDGSEEVSAFLDCWNGAELKVVDCPSFDDNALEALGGNSSFQSMETRNCWNFSPEAVKEMVKTLNESVARNIAGGGYHDRDGFALSHLTIEGHKRPLTIEEKRWFRGNVWSYGHSKWTTSDEVTSLVG